MQTSSRPNRITPEQAVDRLSACVMGTGISYADRGREQGGDYARLAFLYLATLELKFEEDCPAAFREAITHDAAEIQSRRGEEYQVSTCGQTITLGYAIKD